MLTQRLQLYNGSPRIWNGSRWVTGIQKRLTTPDWDAGLRLAMGFQLNGYKNDLILRPPFSRFCPPYPFYIQRTMVSLAGSVVLRPWAVPARATIHSQPYQMEAGRARMDPPAQAGLWVAGGEYDHQVVLSMWWAGPHPGIRSVTTKHLNHTNSILLKICDRQILWLWFSSHLGFSSVNWSDELIL